jgi:hypothetical protein
MCCGNWRIASTYLFSCDAVWGEAAYDKLMVFELSKTRHDDHSNGTGLDTLDPDRETY